MVLYPFANKKVTSDRRKTKEKSEKARYDLLVSPMTNSVFFYNEDKCRTVGNCLLHCGIVHVRFPPDFKINMVIFQAENLCNH